MQPEGSRRKRYLFEILLHIESRVVVVGGGGCEGGIIDSYDLAAVGRSSSNSRSSDISTAALPTPPNSGPEGLNSGPEGLNSGPSDYPVAVARSRSQQHSTLGPRDGLQPFSSKANQHSQSQNSACSVYLLSSSFADHHTLSLSGLGEKSYLWPKKDSIDSLTDGDKEDIKIRLCSGPCPIYQKKIAPSSSSSMADASLYSEACNEFYMKCIRPER